MVETRPERPCAAIPTNVTPQEWGQANTLVAELLDWVGRRGIELAGAPFFRYRVIGGAEKRFSLEVGAPLGSAVPGDGRVIAGALPAGRYATLVHTGHPDRLDGSHTALREWVWENNLTWASHREGGDEVWHGRYESFLTDPAEEPDLRKWSVEIAYLLADDDAA